MIWINARTSLHGKKDTCEVKFEILEGRGKSMKHSLKYNRSGIVFMTVLMVTIVMIIFAVGMTSASVSQSTFVQNEVHRIQAEQLAKGAFWSAYNQNGSCPPTANTSVGGRNFNVNITCGAIGGGTNQTRPVQIAVTY